MENTNENSNQKPDENSNQKPDENSVKKPDENSNQKPDEKNIKVDYETSYKELSAKHDELIKRISDLENFNKDFKDKISPSTSKNVDNSSFNYNK